MPLSRPLLLTCAFALLVSGCDRQTAPPAQPQPSAAAGSAPAAGDEQLTGKLDRGSAGQPMPAVTMTDPAGKTLALASFAGKPVLVNLWATWCAPCVVEMPKLDALAAELHGKLAVVTISEDLDGAAAVKPFYAGRHFANLPQWLDTKTTLPVAYNGASLPLTVLYGKDGKEVWRVIGGYDWSSPAARKQVAEALKT